MAIYKRGRDFKMFFDELSVDIIPIRFVKSITCTLNDGNEIVLSYSEINVDDSIFDVETYIKSLPFQPMLVDLNIKINFDKIQEDVESKVMELLKD